MFARSFPLAAAVLLASFAPLSAEPVPWSVEVSFSGKTRSEPFTGRVLVFFTSKIDGEPRRGPNWLHPEPFISLDVDRWAPDTPLTITHTTPGLRVFPRDFEQQDLSAARVQAVARFQPLERSLGTGPGNGFSCTVPLRSAPDAASPAKLVIDQLVPARTFATTATCRLCEAPSPLLTHFAGRPMSIRAGVVLPPGYRDDAPQPYPVILIIPGFGGSHFLAERLEVQDPLSSEDAPFVRVVLDPSCPEGHHVFADSQNNGPWQTALMTEWLPRFLQEYRVDPRGISLTGHSSGGWSSLWLQVSHPKVFDGVWSTAPDPVDFRDFQQVDIYSANTSVWTDAHSQRRPIARAQGQPIVWWDDFDLMEQVLGHGGQFTSFEAVFSPSHEGRPRPLWNRQTGVIDPVTAEHWQNYDIRRVLEARWPTLQASLAGKLHVFMGELDTFYLTGATRLLKSSLETLGSDAVVEIHAGKDHASLLTAELRQRIRREMSVRYRRPRT